jgi:uncharacterized protein YyaL (SSP411 family)
LLEGGKLNYARIRQPEKLQEGKSNRLAMERSPYLLEHAHNPVDWYSWGAEAFARARNDNKPIFLSIGYSTCHWCHVMRRESFEDEKVAGLINKNFIPIKVDREERPEVDAYYMRAVQTMVGGGGWPLSVFLTPELKPFYGGTYFPPEPKYGMPSFTQVLEFVAKLWKDRKAEVTANSEQVLEAISQKAIPAPSELAKSILDEGFSMIASSFDPEHGGFGGAPKFPLPGMLAFLLRYHHRTGKELALKSVLKTLDEILAGGIRDHIGGGFHRYSTDRVWLVPHFEKMLYDNAQLAKVYAEAFQATGKKEYGRVVEETISWITGEMRDQEGGFYSAQDADTDEGEGTYYTWTPEEILEAAGAEDGALFNRLYGVTRNGNFEGRSILHLNPGSAFISGEGESVARAKRALLNARRKRPRPATDTKVLTSWNGLAISALAFSGMVLGRESYLDDAVRATEFIMKTNSKDGRLLRRYAGGESALEGTLEDYSFFVQGLLDLFEATSEPRWLKEAIRLTRLAVDEFEDHEVGGFYLSLDPAPARLKESYDGPTPSGNSVMAVNLVRLSELTGDEEFRRTEQRTLQYFSREIDQNPSSHVCMLVALDLQLSGGREIVISAPTATSAEEMKMEVFRPFLPDKVVLTATSKTYDELSQMSTLLEGRNPKGRARAYVCKNFTCLLPAGSAKELRAQLAAP